VRIVEAARKYTRFVTHIGHQRVACRTSRRLPSSQSACRSQGPWLARAWIHQSVKPIRTTPATVPRGVYYPCGQGRAPSGRPDATRLPLTTCHWFLESYWEHPARSATTHPRLELRPLGTRVRCPPLRGHVRRRQSASVDDDRSPGRHNRTVPLRRLPMPRSRRRDANRSVASSGIVDGLASDRLLSVDDGGPSCVDGGRAGTVADAWQDEGRKARPKWVSRAHAKNFLDLVKTRNGPASPLDNRDRPTDVPILLAVPICKHRPPTGPPSHSSDAGRTSTFPGDPEATSS